MHMLALRLLLTEHNCFSCCLPVVKAAAHQHDYDKGPCSAYEVGCVYTAMTFARLQHWCGVVTLLCLLLLFSFRCFYNISHYSSGCLEQVWYTGQPTVWRQLADKQTQSPAVSQQIAAFLNLSPSAADRSTAGGCGAAPLGSQQSR